METCPTGKVGFATWGEAAHRVKGMHRHLAHDGEYWEPYRCPDCRNYHIAGRDAKREKAKRRRKRRP